MTDAAIIFRTHFEAIKALPKDQRADAYEALIAYCLDDEIPEDGFPLAMVTMAAPVLDKWKNKRKAGEKGGSVTKTEASEKQAESTMEANVKQNGSTTEANAKLIESESEADEKHAESKCEPKERERERVKEKDVSKDTSKKKAEPKHKYGEMGNVLLTDKEYSKLIEKYGKDKTEKAIAYFDAYIVEKRPKTNSHYLTMLRWVFGAVEEKEQKEQKAQTYPLPDMSKMPKPKPASQNRFNNFDQRQYDYAGLEQAILNAQRARDA